MYIYSYFLSINSKNGITESEKNEYFSNSQYKFPNNCTKNNSNSKQCCIFATLDKNGTLSVFSAWTNFNHADN